MTSISKHAEALLEEIMLHRNSKGYCDSSYWKRRFDNHSDPEEMLLRGTFQELVDAEMVSIKWADGYPYLMFILPKGYYYFEEKKEMKNEEVVHTYTNNFYGQVNDIIIQQGNDNSYHSQNKTVNEEIVNELLGIIEKYDSIIDDDYGIDAAKIVREEANTLTSEMAGQKNKEVMKNALLTIKNVSSGVVGSLIASGILQLLSQL